jgi:ATP-dependent Lhr-like helicase
MVRNPPEILITTPESLNLLLSSRSGLGLLYNIETVILDEIHGVVDNKRGVYLLSAVERLVPLSGEFQRIVLSATVQPLSTVAEFVGGFIQGGTTDAPTWHARDVGIIRVDGEKNYDIVVRCPEATANRPEDEKVWDSLAEDFVSRIGENRSTLFFTNSRALCEKLTYKINAAAGRIVAWAHHGSLSREIRFEVEQKLKAGELPAIVATSTLEMGIDIGELDEVILVQSPGEISSAIQRIGRAGHGVGQTSRCSIYPTHPLDFIEAAVLAKAILDRDIEPLHTIEKPLDVLAQIIISMTAVEEQDVDDLYNEIRRSTAFHNLTRSSFDLVVNMLAGRYADNHLRELRPRVNLDRLNNHIKARQGAVMSLYMSGGVIPDRGYFQMRHNDNNARIGELDEEFVWEATVGNIFALGTQHWRINKITHNDVMVTPVRPTTHAPPFWKAESLSRDFHYAQRIGEFLEHADERLDDEAFEQELAESYHLDPVSTRELISFLRRQRSHCGASVPHRHHLLVEHIKKGPGRSPGKQVVLHTGWGARVNRPLALAMEAAWLDKHGTTPEIATSNESVVIQLQEDVSIDELLSLVPFNSLEDQLRQRLEGSGFFGARFRENAGRALLLSKGRFNERKPLWMSRLQSQKLMSSVSRYEDFPLLLETWRTCLADEFDLAALHQVLEEIETGDISVSEVFTDSPSPFAQSVAWGQINTYMYMDDTPKPDRASKLRPELLDEVVFNPGLRPPVHRHIIEAFESRRQRREAGYAPETDEDLVEWTKERTVIPGDEWQWDEVPTGLTRIGSGETKLVVAQEDHLRVVSALAGENEDATTTCIANWLQYYGPLSEASICRKLNIDPSLLNRTLAILETDKLVIYGQLVEGDSQPFWCDAANYETLLRFMRRSRAPTFEPLPASQLPLFLNHFQARTTTTDSDTRLAEVLDTLRCLPLNPELWESEVLPSRIADYDPAVLDRVLQQAGMIWCGAGTRQVAFCHREDLDLMPPTGEAADIQEIIPDESARYDFATLLDKSRLTANELADRLWQATWDGVAANDSMMALRTGIESGYTVPDVSMAPPASSRRRATRRGGFNQWRSAVPFAGNWYRPGRPETSGDLLEAEEINKDRVRVLIDRYGILFRELLQREAPEFQWRSLFRSMRLMELSGELIGGYFFENIPGPQFASPEGLRILQRPLPADEIHWLNAMDPVSLCGTGIDIFRGELPRRIASNHLVYHGSRLVLVSERNGRALTIHVRPDDDNLPAILSLIRHLLYRRYRPLRKLIVETINGKPANQSEYMDVLNTAFDINHDYKALYIERSV